MNSEEDKIIKKESFEKNINKTSNIMELNNITYINYLYSKKKPIKKDDDDVNMTDKNMNERNNMNIIDMNNMMNNNMNMNNNIYNMMNNMMGNDMMSNDIMNYNMMGNNMMMSNMMNMNNNMMNMSNNMMNMNNNMMNMSNNMMNNNMMSNMNMNNMNSIYANESRIVKEYSNLKSKKLTIIDFIDFIKNLKKEYILFYDFLYPELENIKNIDLGFNGIKLSNNNIFEWEFTLKGPKYSPYSGGLFHLKAFLPKDYPNIPPEICFITPIYHLEVNPDGCYKEKLGHISSLILNCWIPKTTMKEVILSIFPFFYSQITPESPYGSARMNEFFEDNSLFENKIKFFTQKYANPSLYEYLY